MNSTGHSNTGIAAWIGGWGQIALLVKESLASLLTFKVVWRDLLYQIYFIGVKSQSVVLITGAFTGMVLAAQTYYQFHRIKMDTATLAVVGVSMCSELGPVLTGLMAAGRVGAAIAAELGTMRVTEQIDALRTLATHPVDFVLTETTLTNLSGSIERFGRLTPSALGTVSNLNALVAANTLPVTEAISNLNTFATQLSPLAARVNQLVATNEDEINAAMKNLESASGLLTNLLLRFAKRSGTGGEVVARRTNGRECFRAHA